MGKIAVDWGRASNEFDLSPTLIEYQKFLKRIGLKNNTIELYTKLVGTCLQELNTDLPTPNEAERFTNSLHEKKLSRSAVNNFTAAIIKYHMMMN